MEIKFGAGEQPAQTTPTSTTPATAPAAAGTVTVTPTAPAAAPSTAVATTNTNRSLGPTGLVLGDKIPSLDEVILPRLNIVQNIGKLKESFIPGSVVFNQQTVLFVPPKINEKTGVAERIATPPVTLIVLGFRPTRYCEKIEGGVQGMIVNSEADVRTAGGTLDYSEWQLKKASGMKRFEPLADAMIAVERPDNCLDDETVFVYPVGDKKYALGLWAMRGTSYTSAAKRVFFTGRSVGVLRGGYPTWSFAMTTREETYPGGNKAWIPVCLPKAKSTPEFLDFVRSVLQAPTDEATPVD